MEYLEDPTSILIDEVQDLKQKVDKLELFITEKFIHLEKLLEKKINHLEESKLNNVQESLHRMNSHIDFINETYDTLQSPLNYFKQKVEYLMGYEYGYEPQPLPLSLPPSQIPSITNQEKRTK
jgi:predicted nuclease with TOPRIM domain